MYTNSRVGTALLMMLTCNASLAMELDELSEKSSQFYVSPTRLKQNPHDVPASVSKITQDTIKSLQINSIPELFRYVAGMISGNASGNQPRINYHGTNGLVPRRMQVLLDGISVYRPSYAEVNWPTLPVSINEIDTVEVTRSPSAASYGSNSMMAVINIKTKDPYDVPTFGVSGTAGGQGTQIGHLYSSGLINQNMRYRVSASLDRDDGYDKNFRDEERRDGKNVTILNGKISHQMSNNTEYEFSLGYSDALTELEFRDSGQTSFPDIYTDSLYTKLSVKHSFSENHDLKFKSYYTQVNQDMSWRTCYPTILFSENLRNLNLTNPDYAESIVNRKFPTGGSAEDDLLRDSIFSELALLDSNALSPSCGWVNEDSTEKKYDLEIEDTFIISENLRVVSGIGALRQSVFSETFLDGGIDFYSYRIFGNSEYRLGQLVFNVGGMGEDEEGNIDHPMFSPRIGINYRISSSNSIRFILSKAIRTPDIFEQYRNWNYLVRDLSPAYPLDGREDAYFYFNAKSNSDIKSEKIISREISFYSKGSHLLQDGRADHEVDIKYFYDSLSNLVSEKLQFFDYNPTNDGYATLQGFEIDSNVLLRKKSLSDYVEAVDLHFNYAYIDNKTNEFFEKSLHARHSGALYAIAHHPRGWFSSIAYYGNSKISKESFDAWEVGAGKTTVFDQGELTVKGKSVYYPDKENSFVVSESFDVKNVNTNSSILYFTVDYSFR